MKELVVTIIEPSGLHARPASVVVQESNKYQSDLKIKSGDKESNLKSIMSLIGLAVKTGTEVTITATGSDEEEAIAGLKKIMVENSLI